LFPDEGTALRRDQGHGIKVRTADLFWRYAKTVRQNLSLAEFKLSVENDIDGLEQICLLREASLSFLSKFPGPAGIYFLLLQFANPLPQAANSSSSSFFVCLLISLFPQFELLDGHLVIYTLHTVDVVGKFGSQISFRCVVGLALNVTTPFFV